MNQITLEDIQSLVESTDIECKAAQGRDGKGEIPNSIWETYSAMANTSGGHIYLGIEETKDHRFVCRGIKDIQKLQKNLWDTLNSKNKISRNILRISDVEILHVEGLNVLHIQIPRAKRQDRPIYLGTTPFGNTFVRRHEGDYKADDETVRRMMAESVEDSRDDRFLENFGVEDLEKETINVYRNRFSALKPDHPWLELSADDFLVRIGAMGKDRSTGKTWLKIAGLLMFGRYDIIREVFPYYMLDYQERPEPKKESRWIDRIIPDGTWSGNLYDFYQKTIRKLTADIKVPFQLRSETRIDDTPVHQALREALTNALIHADYTGRVSILVVKRPDMFGFRNPGLMRVSVKQAITGGISDCRNHRVQDLFRYIGLGDHAGSGIPGILKSWKSQHWRTPLLYEDRIHEQTVLELRTSSLLPPESIDKLQKMFGKRFSNLSELQRIILVTAEVEDFISHTRIRRLSTDHPKDISFALATLVKENFLEKEGATRDAVYHLPGVRQHDIFANELSYSQDLPQNSQDLPQNSQDLPQNSQDLYERMKKILEKMGHTEVPKKVGRKIMQSIILQLCDSSFLKTRDLSDLLGRDPTFLVQNYLSSLTASGQLELKYPNTRNHPDQAYRRKKDDTEQNHRI